MTLITRTKVRILEITKDILGNGYRYRDSEDLMTPDRCPAVCISADPGSYWEANDNGVVLYVTTIKLDIYVIMGPQYKSIADTDLLQEKVRRQVCSDRLLSQGVGTVKCSYFGAHNFSNEQKIRVLSHDFEVSWYESMTDFDS